MSKCETCNNGISQEEGITVIARCLCHNELICDHCHIEWYNTCIDKDGCSEPPEYYPSYIREESK